MADIPRASRPDENGTMLLPPSVADAGELAELTGRVMALDAKVERLLAPKPIGATEAGLAGLMVERLLAMLNEPSVLAHPANLAILVAALVALVAVPAAQRFLPSALARKAA